MWKLTESILSFAGEVHNLHLRMAVFQFYYIRILRTFSVSLSKSIMLFQFCLIFRSDQGKVWISDLKRPTKNIFRLIVSQASDTEDQLLQKIERLIVAAKNIVNYLPVRNYYTVWA